METLLADGKQRKEEKRKGHKAHCMSSAYISAGGGGSGDGGGGIGDTS